MIVYCTYTVYLYYIVCHAYHIFKLIIYIYIYNVVAGPDIGLMRICLATFDTSHLWISSGPGKVAGVSKKFKAGWPPAWLPDLMRNRFDDLSVRDKYIWEKYWKVHVSFLWHSGWNACALLRWWIWTAGTRIHKPQTPAISSEKTHPKLLRRWWRLTARILMKSHETQWRIDSDRRCLSLEILEVESKTLPATNAVVSRKASRWRWRLRRLARLAPKFWAPSEAKPC